MEFIHTDKFAVASKMSQAKIHTALMNELRRQELEFDESDYGKGLDAFLYENKTNPLGFMVCAFVNEDILSDTLQLGAHTITLAGAGDCSQCGGQLEHFDTLSENQHMLHVEVKCSVCDEITETWLMKDEKYYD